MNQNQLQTPQELPPKKQSGWGIWIIWIVVSIPLLYLFSATFLCEQFGLFYNQSRMGCGSDSAGIPSIIGLVILLAWLIFSIIFFIATKKKVAVWIFGIILFALLGYFVGYRGIYHNYQQNKATSTETNEQDKIWNAFHLLSDDAEKYHSSNNTYVGWQPSATLLNESASQLGSPLNIGVLTESTYVIYAKRPDSDDFYCMDKPSELTGVPKDKVDPKAINCLEMAN